MRKELFERRVKLFIMVSSGEPLKAAAEALSQRYGVTPKTLQNDYAKRREWLPQIFRVQDSAAISELIQGLKLVEKSCWSLYRTSRNDKCRLDALKLLTDVLINQFKIYHDLGSTHLELSELRQFISDTIEQLAAKRARAYINGMLDAAEVEEPGWLAKVLTGLTKNAKDTEKARAHMRGLESL